MKLSPATLSGISESRIERVNGGLTMSAHKLSEMTARLALAAVLSVPAVATALDAQEYNDIHSQCRREAQDYGVAPEQTEEYVNGCVMAYGGMPVAAPEAEVPPVDAGADRPTDDDQDTYDSGEQDAGAAVE
jgi:hypothetical protein